MRTGWLSWVRANDKTIIDVLENQGANLVKATSSLVELLTHYDAVMERKSKIKELEHEGDRILMTFHYYFSNICDPLGSRGHLKANNFYRRNCKLR
jgi:hypothetical protein